MTAKGELQYHWVHWIAPLCAALTNGFFYHFFPPYVRDKVSLDEHGTCFGLNLYRRPFNAYADHYRACAIAYVRSQPGEQRVAIFAIAAL